MRPGVREVPWRDRGGADRLSTAGYLLERARKSGVEWVHDPMEADGARADHVSASRVQALITRRNMSTTQLIIVAVLSLAVVALLMARQRQTD
jgi:hypothetical protein